MTKLQEHLKNLASGTAGLGLFLIGCIAAGLGLSVVFFLALVAMAIAGLGVLAAPLVSFLGRSSADDVEGIVS